MSDINVTVQDEIVNIDVIDTPVLVNVVNSPGQQGPAGPGVPVGGTAGQVLAKNSSTNYDTVWVNQSGGVPYSGATGNVNIGEYELKAGQVTLDTSPTGTAAVGTTRWNDTTGVSETTLKGGSVLLRNGVDLVARVVNKVTPNTTLTKAAYQAVRVSGAQGQRLAVALAQANNDANSADTIGLVTETIAINQEGFIMTVGQLEGINTTGSLQGETWTDGDVLYLSPTTAGALTNIKPTGAGHIVVIGYVEYSHVNNGKIYVKVMNGWELDELHDVDIISPANNQGLFYNSSNLLWENKTIATVLGYTPEQPLTFNSPLSRSVNAVSIPQATGSVNGFLSATDWTTFNSKQAALGFTPANAATTLTINGVTFDLSANRSWTIAAGISGSGAAGQVTYWDGTSSVSGSNNLFWDNANGRLGIGTNAPSRPLTINFNANDGNGLVYLNNPNTGASANAGLVLQATTASGSLFATGSGYTTIGVLQANRVGFYANASFAIAVQSGDFIVGTASTLTERMRLFGSTGNLSIGTASDLGTRLGVVGDTLLRGSGATSATTALTVQNSSSTNLLLLNNAGNLGLGVTPSAWSGGNIIQIGNTSFGDFSSLQLSHNAYYDGTAWRYITNNFASNYFQFAANHIWRNAAFGTAGNAITWTDAMTLNPSGRLLLGGTTDNGQRLQVYGDTLLRGSGNTIATTALTVQNSDSTNLLRIRNSGDIVGTSFFVGTNISTSCGIIAANPSDGSISPITSPTDTALRISDFRNTANSGYSLHLSSIQYSNLAYTSGTGGFLSIQRGFAPTSGTGVFNAMILQNVINQTGGANGITRGLYINPTLTAAADFRAIETTAGNVLFGSNFFWDNANGRLRINGSTSPLRPLEVFNSGNWISATFSGSGGTPKVVVGNLSGNPVIGGHNDALTGWAALAINPDGGNVLIGTSTNGSQKLQVIGDTLLRGSGATSATTALTVQNSSSTNLFTVRNDSRVGIATNAPTAALDVWNATDNAQVRISDSRVTIPDYSGVGYSPVMSTRTLGFFAPASSSTGGVQFSGFTSNTNTGFPFVFVGVHGGTSPTTSALRFGAWKHNGTTGLTVLTGSEIIAGFKTGNNADVFQVKANGTINMSSLPTSSTGLVAGDLWNDAGTVKIV